MLYRDRAKNKSILQLRTMLWLFAVLIVVSGIGVAYIWHRKQSEVKQVRINGGTAIANPNVPAGSGTTQSSPSESKDVTNNMPATPSRPGVEPDKPTGQFVSNHHPNLSGKPAPNTEVSVCSTTPGVTCKIVFHSGNLTKSLPEKPTDAAGNVSWNWTLQNVGLSRGTWSVTAIAINGDKNSSSQDALSLIVGQ